MTMGTSDHSTRLSTTTRSSKTVGIGPYTKFIFMLVCSTAAIGTVGAGVIDDDDSTMAVGDDGEARPCTRKMEIQSPILYKLCLYYTHETGIKELEHEDGRWIEDAKNLLLQNSGANGNGGGSDGSIKREEQPRVHHMFIRFGRRR